MARNRPNSSTMSAFRNFQEIQKRDHNWLWGITKKIVEVRELEPNGEGQIRKRGCSRKESMSQGQEEEQRVHFCTESILAEESK